MANDPTHDRIGNWPGREGMCGHEQQSAARACARPVAGCGPVVRAGKRVVAPATLLQLQQRTRQELERFDPAVRRLVNPHEYPVGLTEQLYAERVRLIQAARSARRRA